MYLRAMATLLFSSILLVGLTTYSGNAEELDNLTYLQRSPRETVQRNCYPSMHRSNRWCYKTFYTSEKRKTGGSWWRSTKYYYVRVSEKKHVCCNGYGGSRCEPMCHGDYRINSCNRHEGRVVHIDKQVITCSGGACIAPDTCSSCNTGYYADNRGGQGYCRSCKPIDHCNIPRCSDGTHTVCSRCDGEEKYNSFGYYAYTHHVDASKCQRACSWRDGTRCYPGACSGDMLYPSQCQCAEGYGGSDCATFLTSAIDKLKINSPELVWTADPRDPKLFLPDPKYPDRKIWTKRIDWEKIAVEIPTSYDVPPISNETRQKQTYIDLDATKVGIEKVDFSAILQREIQIENSTETKRATWSRTQNCQFSASCKIKLDDTDIRTTPWNNILQGGYPTPFNHLDLVVVTISMKNGGIVYYKNREHDNRREHYSIRGATVSKTLELQFDLYPPDHCMEEADPCTKQPLVTPDFTKQTSFEVTWDGWSDKDSGLQRLDFQVVPLKVMDAKSGVLTSDGTPVFETSVNATEGAATINMTVPGPYFLEMSVYDWAENEKSTRRIFIFDDESNVTQVGAAPLVKTADEKTNHRWINEQADDIKIIWPDRFKNEMHMSNQWLNAVASLDHVPRELDDTETISNRTTSKIKNIQGIVKFTIGYDIRYDLNSTPQAVDFVTVPDDMFDKQMMNIKEDFIDGKQLTFKIRGYDVMDNFEEDNITVTIDLSPPVIQNMWLTKGDVVNITVHSEEELNKMTFEWEVFDVHSGLHKISWRIFDNYTKTDVVHGMAFESPQGETENLDECERKYANFSRGFNCYCTPFNGCFHRHFSVTPRVTTSKEDGLLAGMQTGVHESDYFIEVTAVNSAFLKSVAVLKVTIDTSPPHEGTVHDGFSGQPEVDFQQSLSLTSYWDGFFDKESGVWFYMFGYAKNCLNESVFDIGKPMYNSANRSITQTYSTTAHYEAPDAGTYYITVAAYNHALDHSKPVCSDGITIDTSEAKISNVVVKGAVTREGLVKNGSNRVWLLKKNRVLTEIHRPPQLCIDKATLLSENEIQVLPIQRRANGSIQYIYSSASCHDYGGVPQELASFITSNTQLEISWNVTDTSVQVHEFEVGLSSHNATADKMPLVSSLQHQHIRLSKPNIWDGEMFYIVIRSVTKAAVKHNTVIGPFIVDTTKPDFKGTINVTLEQSGGFRHLIARWDSTAFEDHGDPSPLSYQVAIGSHKYGRDVLPFQKLSPGCSCKVPVTCTAINTDRLKWRLHGHQRYYVTIKASNSVGLFTLATSNEYIHDVELPSPGVVFDVDPDTKLIFQDIEDIDFQSKLTSLTCQWTGFKHPHLKVLYTVCVMQSNSSDYIKCVDTGDNSSFTFTLLQLTPFETYRQVVIAKTEAGNVTVTSDGVTIVEENYELQNISIYDGIGCVNENRTQTQGFQASHHINDIEAPCKEDLNYQASTNELHAYWTVPEDIKGYTPDAYIAVFQRAPIADIWTPFKDYEHVKTTNHTKMSDLSLMPGRRYRVSLKLCAASYCYKPVHSHGVTVIARPPTTGKLEATYNNITNKVLVEFDAFQDPDMEDPDEAREVMNYYEWAFTDNSHHGSLVTTWQRTNISTNRLKTMITFEINFNTSITFSKCWKVSVRGYTHAGLSAVISSEIRNCSDIHQMSPRTVLDAVGDPLYTKDTSLVVHKGQMVRLPENAAWTEPDREYTPYTNVISAVWPKLRYPEYEWAVLEVQDEDPTMFYHSDTVDILDPCGHPDAIHCGHTGDEYINAAFSEGELKHGKRYKVCIHSNATIIAYERWSLELEELSACSDGITVDLSAPTPGKVWIGKKETDKFQTSSVCITVNWRSFIDVEEEGQSSHTSGVTSYKVAIGSAHGGNDIVNYFDVGLTNHHMLHGLHLENGHTYYATVIAEDFTHQTAQSVSRPIMVDTSAPELTGNPITVSNRQITNTISVSACWKNVFRDKESGISHYEWSVGSRRGHDDMMPYTFTTSECDESDESNPLNLREGHAYFVSVKAYNNAGHYELAVSWAFVVDASPPSEGHVYDGPRAPDGTLHDIDFLTNTTTIEAHWTGFHEPHGTVKEYTVHVGSCVGCDDILKHQPVGIADGITMDKLRLSEGQMVYVTVSACNTADLCTSATSDGVLVDQSPPIAGSVFDGVEGVDIQYQSSRIYLGAKWYGFTDAQSEISHFVWRAGTSPGQDDILMATDVHKTTEAFIVDLLALTGKQLPVEVRIYITVRAYNKAGLYSEATSNGFMVDVTGPVFSNHISHNRIGSAISETSVLPSLIKVEWNVVDEESFIDAQYLSIVSHIGGDFNASSIKVEGIVRDYTLTGLDLHDGSKYCVMLVSCNRAGLCSESKLQHLLVDSTPPTPGMFAINTDHSAGLDRQPEDWMTWAVPYVRLAWLGFEDVHSGIDRYLINIGSTFMGNDLHKMSSDPHVVLHNDSGVDTDEGKIQVQQIWTKSLSKYKTIFVSIWAINGVGLSSPVIHHEFDLVYGGMMALVRRCEAHTCLGHCVCAPHGQLCSAKRGCHDISGDKNGSVSVKDFTDIRFPKNAPFVNHTPVNTMSAAHWNLRTNEHTPIWYEWSVGYTMYDSPKGVFDLTHDQVWHCGGKNMSWTMSHPRGHYLTEKMTYSFFVRAWYDNNTFAVFKSPGVMVFTTPPKVISVQGKMVKEILHFNGKDVDYVNPSQPLVIDWNGRFSNNKQCLTRYHLYISTYPGGHDTFCIDKHIAPTQTSMNVTGYKLEENTVYYSVVQAYNMAGMHTTQWSDGFLIDNRPPAAGIVHDGEVFADVHAFNSSHYIPSFWSGFTDAESGISSYNVCVSTKGSRIHCDIVPPTNVGIQNTARFYPTSTVPDGTVLTSEVQAFDYVGHGSARVRSNGAVIDTSPPKRLRYLSFDSTVIQNPSFENALLVSKLEELSSLDKCDSDLPSHWVPKENSCVILVSMNKVQDVPDGQRFVVVKGGIQQSLSNLTPGFKYRLTFYISHVPMETSMLSTGEGIAALDDDRHVFLLYKKPELSQDKGEKTFELLWHKHVLFFDVKSPEANLSISTIGKSCYFAVDNVNLEKEQTQGKAIEGAEANGHVKVHTVFIHDFSALHASWNLVDEESDITEYLWAIGTSEGGTQLQPFTSTGRRSFAYTYSLHLVHDTNLYVSVVAVNGAGLRTVSFSEAVRVDLTPPVFAWIRDGPIPGEDIDYQRERTVSASWEVDDIESGIKSCQWAVENSVGDQILVAFTEVENDFKNMSADIPISPLPDGEIQVIVKCTNYAGLSAHAHTNGIRIISKPPSADQVVLDVLGVSMTQYPVHGNYHGDKTQVRFRWTGFENNDGIDSFLVMLDGEQFHVEELVAGTTLGSTYASFTNLTLKDGNFSVTVTAINQLDMYSQKRVSNFIMSTSPPKHTGRSVASVWDRSGHTLKVDWNGVYRCPHELYYEVTVSWEDGGDGDIIQWEETKKTQFQGKLNVDDVPESGIYVRISVRAITPAGFYETANTKCFIDK